MSVNANVKSTDINPTLEELQKFNSRQDTSNDLDESDDEGRNEVRIHCFLLQYSLHPSDTGHI